jgi:hypothetical protein
MRVTAVVFFILSLSAAAFAQDRVLWDEQFDAAGGGDIARAIAVTGKTVVVTGGTSTAAGTEMAVRSYNKKTGRVRWSDSAPLVNGVQTAVYATRVAGVVYTAGYAPNGVGSDIAFHAYDANTGAHLWQDVLDRGRDDFPRDLAASQAAVVVVGYGGNTPGRNVDLLVRAYHPVTGQVLWDDQIDTDGQSDDAFRVGLTDTQVIVGGMTSIGTTRTLILRAYDVATGALSWDVRETDFSPTALTIRGGRVFVGGSSATLATTRAYKATTGKLLWQDQGSSGTVRDMQVRAGQLVEVGNFGVRLMDVKSGDAAWESPSAASEFLSMVELGASAIYIAGSSGNEFASESVVRAYDYSGNAIWEDRAYRSSDTQPHALTLSGRKLFVAGHVTKGDGVNFDFFIRAYDVRDLEQPNDGE